MSAKIDVLTENWASISNGEFKRFYINGDTDRAALPKEQPEEIVAAVLAAWGTEKTKRIAELKSKLQDTDYHIIKVMEGVSTFAECAEIMQQRATWRKEINKLERESTDYGI